jgi:acyl carrier protein
MSQVEYDRARILRDLVAMLEDMTSDWDTEFDEAIGPQTRLIGDLEFESIDVVQFILGIEELYRRKKLPFERLIMRDGRYVSEILVGDAVDFLHEELNKTAA